MVRENEFFFNESQIAGSSASNSGTTAVRCTSDSILPEYSANRSSARLRVVSVNRSEAQRLVISTTPMASKISKVAESRMRQDFPGATSELRLGSAAALHW